MDKVVSSVSHCGYIYIFTERGYVYKMEINPQHSWDIKFHRIGEITLLGAP